MSRIGKKAVALPKGVSASVEGQQVSVKGPKGTLSFVASDDIEVKMDNGSISVMPRDESKRARSSWGMSRTMVSNLIAGVTQGFERRLEINGVGYRAAVAGKDLQLSLGYSHEVKYPIPAGIKIETPKPTEIVVSGADKQQVGQVAAEIPSIASRSPTRARA
jgi:large subunit ribosomal protein L6